MCWRRRIPAVSINSQTSPSICTSSSTGLRVVPAMSSTTARVSPAREFNSETYRHSGALRLPHGEALVPSVHLYRRILQVTYQPKHPADRQCHVHADQTRGEDNQNQAPIMPQHQTLEIDHRPY